jgi:hypothetical protein
VGYGSVVGVPQSIHNAAASQRRSHPYPSSIYRYLRYYTTRTSRRLASFVTIIYLGLLTRTRNREIPDKILGNSIFSILEL